MHIMITFQTLNVEMPPINVEKVTKWIGEVAFNHGKRAGNINYCFCDDEEILRSNKEFLNHDYFTDIITFDYSREDRISGDLLISLETVASNAGKFGVQNSEELLRVMIHGVLHLCGINDKGPGEREIMEKAENEALSMYYSI